MALELRQQLKMSLQLKMTPQLQQAIKLLQLTRMELVEQVQQELVDNPMLEEGAGEQDEPDERSRPPDMAHEGIAQERANLDAPDRGEGSAEGRAVNEIDWDAYLEHHALAPPMPASRRAAPDDLPSLESTLTRKASLSDYLLWQLKMHPISEAEERIGREIIGNIDDSGYLREPPLADIAIAADVGLELAEKVLEWIQTFEPIGVAARSLKECLLIQAEHAGQDDEIVVRMIDEHLGNLERRNYRAIAQALGQPLDEIYEAVKVVIAFDPKPGSQYAIDEPVYVTPDVYIHQVAGEYFVVPNDDGLPKLKIASFYRTALAGGKATRTYVQDKMRAAQWLIRSIQQRQRTIIRVTESILRFQREFFERGVQHLRPLILRDVADDISMHESTVSRVTTNKYVHTPRGIFELKFFFNAGINRTCGPEIASQSVKNRIEAILGKEDARRPYSDQKIVELLREQQIDIARRTVAKYRDQLGILSSSRRKRVF